jgi:small GTP-binding protein
MGYYLSKFYAYFTSWNAIKPSRILLLGLNNAGKTCILYRLKLNEFVAAPIATVGYNVETITPFEGVSLTVWDIGGQEKIRFLWKNYFKKANGLLFVVDSSDKERMIEASEELHCVLRDENMNGVPVVIIANKKDLPNSPTPDEIVKILKLENLTITKNKWDIQTTCATTGEGIYEGIKKLCDMIKEKNT